MTGIPFGQTMIIIKFFFLNILSLLFVCSYAQAGIKSEYKNIIQQMSRQFWANTQAKLSLLPTNYKIHDLPNYREFESSHGRGCKKSSQTNGDIVGGIQYSTTQNTKELIYDITYVGCSNKVIFHEKIIAKQTSKTTPNINSVLSGSRNFAASTDTPFKSHHFFDSTTKSIALIESSYTSTEAKTQFIFFNELLIEVIANFTTNRLQVFANSKEFSYKFPFNKKFSEKIKHSVSPVIHQIDFLTSGTKKYSFISKTQTGQSLKTFNSYYSLVVLSDLKKTFGKVFDLFLTKLPKTETSSSGLANRRLLNELIVITNKLRSSGPVDINFVSAQIKSYIKAIEDGKLTIIDNRPQ